MTVTDHGGAGVSCMIHSGSPTPSRIADSVSAVIPRKTRSLSALDRVGLWFSSASVCSTRGKLRHTADVVTPTPTSTPEDLLVIYLGRPLAAEMVTQAVEHGGTVTPAHNPYWDRGGVTICDPDGYRVVLSDQSWDSAE
jgi:hypothetical protein